MNNNIGIEEFDSKFFDESSNAWNMNKIKHLNGMYTYKCQFIKKNGEYCKNPICKNHNSNNNYCNLHSKNNKKRKINEI